jgi:cytidine deaminase
MPDLVPVGEEDKALYESAVAIIRARFREGRHHVGAAVRGGSGRIHTGLHLQAVVGEPAICAEAIAIGRAMAEGEERISACVAVRHPKEREAGGAPRVLPPCGSCRDLVADYGGKDAWILLEVDGKLVKTRISELIPLRRWARGASPVE